MTISTTQNFKTIVDPGSHVVVLHRWRDDYALYTNYINHALHDVTFITTPLAGSAAPTEAAEVVVVNDLTNFEQVSTVVEGLVRRFGRPKAVVALQEGDLAVAAQLREMFDLPGRRSDDLVPFLDKHEMLLAARRVGVSMPVFRLVQSSADVGEFAQQVGWPLVIKPLHGRASLGVKRLNGPADISDLVWNDDDPVLAQEYVDDEVAHVDGYFDGVEISPWRAAKYVNLPDPATNGPLAFTYGEPTGEVEIDNPAELAAIETFLRTLIPGLSSRPWVFHLEIFIGRGGPSGAGVHCQFLEVGCRPGGGEIPFVWRDVYGVDLMALEFGLQCGQVPEAPSIAEGAEIGGSLLVPLVGERPCRIVSASGMTDRELGPYSEKLPEAGTIVPAIEGTYEHIGGRFRFRGASTEDVRRKILDTAINYEVECLPAGGRVAIIGGRTRVARAAAELGLDVVVVHAPGRYEPEVLEYCEQVIETDLLDEDSVVRIIEELHAERPFMRVLSVAEDGLLPSARVNEAHGLGGDTVETVRLLKDKWLMRRHLRDVGLSPVRARTVGSPRELAEFVEAIGGAVIVKPLDAGGSQLIRRVDSAEEAFAVWPEFDTAGRQLMLAEEFLDGPEISVEAFSFEGRHTVLAMTDKVLGPNFVEIGHSMPANLDDDLSEELRRMTVALLDSVGLREGPSHTELKLTSSGPRIVESHTRIGGDNIVDLANHVYGVDLEELAVSVPLGHRRWDHIAPTGHGGAAIRYLNPEPGIIESVEMPSDIASEPGITLGIKAEPGMTVPEVKWSLDRVCGWVMATGQSGPDAAARCDKVIDGIRLDMSPRPVAPALA